MSTARRNLPVFATLLWLLVFSQAVQATTEVPGCLDHAGSWETLSEIQVGPFEGRCMALQDGTVYAAGADRARLHIFDTTNPAAPIHKGYLETEGIVTGLASRPGDLLATVEGVGLVRYDLSDPWNPVAMETLDLGFQHFDVVMDGDLAYVALGGSGVRVVSLEYPGLTLPLGQTAVGGAARCLALDGSLLHVGVNPNGLVVVDVADPGNPQVLGDMPFPLMPRRIHAAHGRVAISGGGVNQSAWLVWVCDVSDPYQPNLIADREGSTSTSWPPEVFLRAADRLYVGHHNQVTDHRVQGFDLLEQGVLYSSGGDIVQSDGLIYIVGNLKLTIGPVAPFSPSPYGQLSSAGGRHSFREDDMVFIADGYGLRAVDLSDPLNPVQGQAVTLANESWSPALAKYGSTVFINIPGHGLEVVDVSDPLAPQSAGVVSLADGPWGLLAEDGYLYAATDATGLLVLDLEHENYPAVVVGYWPNSGTANNRQAKMVKRGDELLVQAYEGGVDVFDVSDPANPILTDHIPVPGIILDMDLLGDHLLVCRQNVSMALYSRGAESWEALGFGPQLARSATVHGDLFYADALLSRIEIYRIMDGQPQLRGVQENGYAPEYLLAGDEWVLAGTTNHGILLPSQCQEIISAVDGVPGLAAMLGPAVPNPFNPRTEISFTIPVAGPGSLCIYNVRGELVRTLHDGLFEAGEGAVTWNGRAADGSRAGSGVYLYRLEMGGYGESRRVVLLK